MENNHELHTFAEALHQECMSISEREDVLYVEAFTQYIIDLLTEKDELENGSYAYHKTRGIEVSGYGIDSDDGTLNLFTTLSRSTIPPATIGKSDVEAAFRRLNAFLQKTMTGPYYLDLEESTLAFDMAEDIYASRQSITRVCLYLFTDGLTTLDKILETRFDTLHVSCHVWDIRRLYQAISSGKQQEPVHIDFIEQFGAALPCLKGFENSDDYEAYLAVLPGAILKSLYELYGARLLELNVRSYLQAKGKVNQGIRRTILDEPERFLAYNNGISATASNIQLAPLPEGGYGIQSLDDLQIVNGGQTTASIFHTALKDKADISRVYVQAKISVIERERASSLVPFISRYANSQNKVNEADFSANDPMHVKLEELSRTIWAPATENAQRPTRWFYERARGQYQNGVNRGGTVASQRQFKAAHPLAQKFTRTDLAKFEMTWEQAPHIVSLGAQKCFMQFNVLLQKRGAFEVNLLYFQRLIAKAILFRKAEGIISKQHFGGYRANIVTYTLAYIYYHTAEHINLDMIWQRQTPGKVLCEMIECVSRQVHAVLIAPPSSKNVTEWCKRSDCWTTIRDLQIELPSLQQNDPFFKASEEDTTGNQSTDTPDEEMLASLAQIAAIPWQVWSHLATWSKITHHFDASKRRFTSSFSRDRKKCLSPSAKDAERAMAILKQAQKLGFKAEAPVD